jgi:hypothetical protein
MAEIKRGVFEWLADSQASPTPPNGPLQDFMVELFRSSQVGKMDHFTIDEGGAYCGYDKDGNLLGILGPALVEAIDDWEGEDGGV